MRRKNVLAGLALTAAALVAALGATPTAAATTDHAGAPAGSTTKGTMTVGTRDGGTRTVPVPSGARDDRAARAAGPSYHGCPYGASCVYPANKGWNGDHPKYVFYSFAGHNLSAEYGTHRIADNQYGSHATAICKGYNGSGGYPGLVGVLAIGYPSYHRLYWDQKPHPAGRSRNLRARPRSWCTRCRRPPWDPTGHRV